MVAGCFLDAFKKTCLEELLTGGIRERGKIAEHSRGGGWEENKNNMGHGILLGVWNKDGNRQG